MKKRTKVILALVLCICMSLMSACGQMASRSRMSKEDALEEINSLMKKVNINKVSDPAVDITLTDSTTPLLADISTFPLVLEGHGDINIEIACPSELCDNAPDDFFIVAGKQFNEEGHQINGKTVSVSIRKISSGEAATYIGTGNYMPDAYVPSNEIFGLITEAQGVSMTKEYQRLIGNTAGLLLKKNIYDTIEKDYGEVSVKTVLAAANDGKVNFAYTNPYTSATGLNILFTMLEAFDEDNPISEQASEALMEYQKSAPPVAYTTGVLRDSAKKGIINAMVMEEQAYINTPALKDYIYVPEGMRHDHPLYTFSWTSEENREAVREFAEYILSNDMQNLAKEKGFNRNDDYKAAHEARDGATYLAAQKIWKENKTGGKPIVAVFICDISGSMDGEPLNTLKTSLVHASEYIGDSHYVGLVSYSSDVTVNLDIAAFDAMQRAKFAGEVKNLYASGSTATYDAVLVGAKMIAEKMAELGDVKPLLFVLTDGEQNEGYPLDRVTGVIEGLSIPVYTIAYNYSDNGDLEQLSGINEAATIKAGTDDIVNQLRNLFNANM